MLPNNIMLIGGGASIRYLGALDKGLFTYLQDKFTIGLNYSYKFFNTTFQMGNDQGLYNSVDERKGSHEEIAKLPLWVGKEYKCLKNREPNSIFLKYSKKYDRDLKSGVYKGTLTGISAISLAIFLMDLAKNQDKLSQSGIVPAIYLLGFDSGQIEIDGKPILDSKGLPLTSWYQEEFRHPGTGKVSMYKQIRTDLNSKTKRSCADYDYLPFTQVKDVKIYNVGGLSKIPHFEHISYEDFFMKKLTIVHNQDALRNEIREILLWLKTENNI